MRRDMGLVKDILIRIENAEDATNFYSIFPEYIEKYQVKKGFEEQADLSFKHLNLLVSSGFVSGNGDRTGTIQGLTWEGHNLIDQIRDNQY